MDVLFKPGDSRDLTSCADPADPTAPALCVGKVVTGVLFSIMPVIGMKIKFQSRTIQGEKV